MYLFLNSLESKYTYLALIFSQQKISKGKNSIIENNNKEFKIKIEIKQRKTVNRNEKILIGIEKILKTSKTQLRNLNGIIVVNGPGSFSGVRIVLSVANTLGWLLNIPVIGISVQPNQNNNQNNLELISQGLKKIKSKKEFKMVKPFYGKEPNISKAKRKF